MSYGMIGLALGALLGGISYGTLMKLKNHVDKDETKRLLTVVGFIELAMMPVLGYLVGAFLLDGSGS